MTSGGRNGIECAVIIKRDGCLLVDQKKFCVNECVCYEKG